MIQPVRVVRSSTLFEGKLVNIWRSVIDGRLRGELQDHQRIYHEAEFLPHIDFVPQLVVSGRKTLGAEDSWWCCQVRQRALYARSTGTGYKMAQKHMCLVVRLALQGLVQW